MSTLKRLMLSGLALVALSGAVLAGGLTPAMETYLAAKADGDLVHTLLLLEDRLDVKALDWQLHDEGASFADRHRIVITRLQEHAAATQASLLADLEVRRQLGEIESYEPYWILNGVFVSCKTEDVVRDLAARLDVEVAETPLVIDLIQPTERGDAVGGDRGIGITPGVVNIGARRVWTDLGINGEGALVANLDTGVDGNHIALRDRWRGTHAPAEECWLDFVGAFDNPPVDSDSHGTHTMGTMCGLALDDTIGVAPRAEWIAANTIVGGSLGSQVLETMEWLADPDGDPLTTDDVPDVANNSWGVNESFGYPDCYSGWWDAIDACEAAGVMHVWSAGNEGPGASTLRSPADRATTMYDSFSVGSTLTGYPFNIAYDSSRGPAGATCGPAENLIKPEVSAPGVGVYSSIPGNGYTYYSGTSMAAPHVCGAVALMRSANQELDVITLKQILMDTAMDLGAAGEDNTYGHGIIDVFDAVSAVLSGYGLVAGTVVDDDTGLPVSGAVVTTGSSAQTDITEADGSFVLNAPAGETTLMVTMFGYEDYSTPITVPAGDEINPEVRLVPQPNIVLQGTVYGPGDVPPGGSPALGVVVQLEGTPLASVTTAADGLWSITAPQDTEYTVRASLGSVGSCVQILPAMTDLECDLYLRAEVADGFESGDFGSLAWTSTGAAYWEVSDADAQEGSFSARSGEIGGSETSILNLAATLDEAGPMTFWVKTQGGGSLSFWDGYATIETWIDQATWLEYSYDAPVGDHTFRWRYSTTSSGGGAGDRGYLDLVTLPGGEAAAPRAVTCPAPVAVEVDLDGTTTATLLVLNQGVEDLSWTLNDAAPYVVPEPTAGMVTPSGYAPVELAIDAAGLNLGVHQYNLTLASNDPANPSLTVVVQVTVADISTGVTETPRSAVLFGAVPNPFNPQTNVRFSLPAAQSVNLSVYDVQGRLVRTLVDGVRQAGLNDVLWDGRDRSGRDVASGTYFARLRTSGSPEVKSMVLVR